jgi:serine/threonine protein kinase
MSRVAPSGPPVATWARSLSDSDSPRTTGSNTILHLGAAPVPLSRARLRTPKASAAVARTIEPLSSPARFAEGDIVGDTPYRIIRFLGDGGMGAVYEAEHIHLERRVALKILLPEVCKNPQVLQLFRTEAKTASRIGSEHIVELYDFAELPDGRLLFTMELLKGPTIADEIEHRPMPPARVIAILRQVCKGLSAAHSAGIVHRDIKPENIVLTTLRGRADTVKILDFGIAAILGEESAGPLQAGTPHYLAPELINGTGFDDRADIYALGCTAFAMLTGHPPFDATGEDAVAEILAAHLADPVPVLSEVRRELVDVQGLCAVVQRCLAKVPEQRYGSIDELEADLCGAQIAARIETSWDDLQLPERVPAAIREKLFREMPTLETIEPAGRRRWVWPVALVATLAIGAGITYAWLARTPTDAAETEAAASEVDNYVETLVAEARAAADAGLYIYPPPDDPTAATAYGRVRELEAVSGDDAEDARRHALRLRQEFAALLVRLGDEHWGREGEMEFAEEYYAQALLFDREQPRALERTTVAPEEIDALVTKAEAGKFSSDEIQAAATRRTRDRAVLSATRATAGGSDAPAPTTAAPVVPERNAEQQSARDLAKLAHDLLRKGEVAKAEDFIGRALVFNPRDELALATRFEIMQKAGDHAAALEVAVSLAGIAPRSGKSHMRVGRTHAKLGHWQQAYDAFAKANDLGAEGATSALADAVSHGAKAPPPPEPEPEPEPTAKGAAAEEDDDEADDDAAGDAGNDEEPTEDDESPAPASPVPAASEVP